MTAPQTPIDEILMYLVLGEGAIELSESVKARAIETKSAIYNLLAKEAVELYGPNPNAETVLAIKAVPLEQVKQIFGIEK